ncbi:hypothetical protein Q7P37_001485 [Cladosporium fusiforme]
MDEDDYEKANAREWDLNYKAPAKNEKPPSDSIKRPRYQQQPLKNQHPRNADLRKRQSFPPVQQPSWLGDGAARKRQQVRHEPQSLLIDLGHDLPDTAEEAWRGQKAPVDFVTVPLEFAWRIDQQNEDLAHRHGAFISTSGRSNSDNKVRFDIWGDLEAVHHTKRAIYDWVQREKQSKRQMGKSAFYKTGSLTDHQRKAEERHWTREVKRQRFRQEPPALTPFGAIGTFHWPVQEYQPHEVLGKFYEALDPIRMECSCYVVFEKTNQVFQVMGEADAVKTALLRIRKACFQIAARQIAPIRRYFLRFDNSRGNDSVKIPSGVTLQPFDRIKRIGGIASNAQEGPAKCPREDDEHATGVVRNHVLTLSTRHVELAGKSILLMIAKLHYYRGHLKFRIRLGTFLATHYKATQQNTPDDSDYSIDDFQNMLEQSQFAGEVTTELGDQYSETTALQTLQSKEDLLFPRDSTVKMLLDVKPTYTAIITFADKAGDLQLEVSWHPVNDGGRVALERLPKRWTRLDRGATSASSLVDINLLNLRKGAAWQFDMTASQIVEDSRLSPELQRLADTIRINDKIAQQQNTEKPFVQFNPNPYVKSLQQRTTYQFGIANSDFYLELSRFQDFVFARKSRKPGDTDCQVYEVRWSLEVYHNTWDRLLTRNAHIAVGQMADWDDDVETWFPEDDVPGDFEQVKGESGFEQLVAKLGLIEKAVFRSESEMFESFGGMEVG